MHKYFPLVVVMGMCAAGCSPATDSPQRTVTNSSLVATSATAARSDALVQYSLIAALAAGDYADGFPLREVLDGGDFGIGTFDRLAGEMIVLDGRMYQALTDGTVRQADLGSTTPFAAVTFFNEDGRFEKVAATSLEDLDQQLDRTLPRRNSPYALRLEGTFRAITLRSVPAQSPPFQPLVKIVQDQSTWRKQNVRGVMLGFRCPAWVGTLNVAGYHWHFLSDDHQTGGHVLDCEIDSGLLTYDECSALLIEIPQTKKFDNFDADAIKKQDINTIERQRQPAGE